MRASFFRAFDAGGLPIASSTFDMAIIKALKVEYSGLDARTPDMQCRLAKVDHGSRGVPASTVLPAQPVPGRQ